MRSARLIGTGAYGPIDQLSRTKRMYSTRSTSVLFNVSCATIKGASTVG